MNEIYDFINYKYKCLLNKCKREHIRGTLYYFES
jgi:hypothetical protein